MIRALLIAALALPAHAAEKEAVYRDRFCAGMRMEVHLKNGPRADCVSGRLAIEVEFGEKWHQAIGQALSYSASTGHAPAIILVCRQKRKDTPRRAEARCLKYYHRLEDTAVGWKLPLTVWRCDTSTPSLDKCEREDLGGAR
jgi:hypothetical protein